MSRLMNSIAKPLVFGLLLTSASIALAEPSIQQVYQAARSGNLPQAETMMQEVIQAHPNSAKAHFIYAEILAKDHRIADARNQLAQAESLKPGLPDEKPQAVNALKQTLGMAAATSQSSGGGWMIWGGLLLLGLMVVLVLRSLFSRPPIAPAYVPAPGYGNNGPVPGYGPGYGPNYPGQGGGMGSSIMGGLATGAAVGAGVVAGEVLMHKILDDQPHSNGYVPQGPMDDSYDMGGSNFGVNDTSSWDDGGSSFSDMDSGDNSSDWS